jgi:catechol 2,3-dioxygenase-like lactoylglutathione lyase family enzyme
MPQLVHSRSVLAVRDLHASTRFYIDVLGFVRDFGDGSDGWSFLSRDGFRVMLGECPDATPPGDHAWYAYVTTEGVDELHEEVAGRGAEILSPPATKPWGLREFSLRTPDGHRVVFGEPTSVATLAAPSPG